MFTKTIGSSPDLPQSHRPFLSRRSPKFVIPFSTLCANLLFFVFGTAAWVFKIGDTSTGTLLPYSFTQVALPLVALFAFILVVQVWRLRVPQVGIRSWSMFAVNLGLTIILIGTAIQFGRNGAYRMDAALHFVKWALPWCALLLVFVGLLFGGDRDWLVYGLLFGCVLSVACVEASRVGIPIPIAKLDATRLAGLLSHPNQYGILLSSLAPFSIYVLHKRGLINRLIGAISIPFFAVGLFECLSKTNIVVWPIVMVIMLLLYSCNDAKKLFRTLILIGICAIASASVVGVGLQALEALGQSSFQGMSKFFEDPTSMRSLDDRQDAWDEASEYIRQSPWLGEGPGWASQHLMFIHAHNLFLQAWIDVGIFGIAGTVLITIGILVRNWELVYSVLRRKIEMNDETRLQMATAVGLVAAVFGNSMSASLQVETLVPFSILIGLAFANPHIAALPLGKKLRKRIVQLKANHVPRVS